MLPTSPHHARGEVTSIERKERRYGATTVRTAVRLRRYHARDNRRRYVTSGGSGCHARARLRSRYVDSHVAPTKCHLSIFRPVIQKKMSSVYNGQQSVCVYVWCGVWVARQRVRCVCKGVCVAMRWGGVGNRGTCKGKVGSGAGQVRGSSAQWR